MARSLFPVNFKKGRIFSSVLIPIPLTEMRESTVLKEPFFSLWEKIASDFTSPTKGSKRSSFRVAELTFSFPVSASAALDVKGNRRCTKRAKKRQRRKKRRREALAERDKQGSQKAPMAGARSPSYINNYSTSKTVLYKETKSEHHSILSAVKINQKAPLAYQKILFELDEPLRQSLLRIH